MRQVSPLTLLPVGVLAFLGGIAASVSRRGLSMLPKTDGPIDGVPVVAWRRFVTVMTVLPRDAETPRGRVGMFGMDARRLRDVGFMTEARKATVAGEPGVWTGSWREPLTRKKFLTSEPLQHEAFRRSMVALAPKVSEHVGRDVDGVPATLSGLLGVGHLAGEAGVAGWVSDPKVRERFAATTQNFHRCNGIF